jgi:thiol peroxidase
MQVTFQGQPLRLVGLPLKVGDRARDVRVIGNDLSPVLPLERSQGKIRLFLTVPSLDTSICSIVTQNFSRILTPLMQRDDSLAVFLISADLPFAQTRWQAIEKVTNIILLSDYRDMDFARSWGLLIQAWGLLARAVYIVDRTNIVTYREVISELTLEPNYQAATEALQALV